MLGSDSPQTLKTPTERKLSYREIAAEWKLSIETVRRLFDGEPGTVRFGHPDTRRKRRYFVARVPESVVNRVIAARTVGQEGDR
jgi:hypothetical protein